MLSEQRRTLPAGDWNRVRRRFRWNIPDRFNIAVACADDWARAAPNAPAIIDTDGEGVRRVWIYADLKDASDRLASALRARGVGRGDRVAVLLSQSPEVMVAHFAAMKLGAIVLPLFTLFGDEALGFRLADSGARAAITDDANLDKLMDVAASSTALETVITVDQCTA